MQQQPRVRRGLINVIGHGLKELFGPATESDVSDNMKQMVRELADQQGRIVSHLDKFTTIINHTYDEIQINREHLNLLTR